MNENFVRLWEETCTIPTYSLGAPDKNPRFSSQSVYTVHAYPYPVVDKILDRKADIAYQALFLENAYLKVMILPQLGGRVQMVYDKIRNQHLVSHHQAIRPVWAGEAGLQLAGGITWHRTGQRQSHPQAAADYLLESHPDGSKTIWLYLLDAHAPVQAKVGFRLCMDKAYLEVRITLCNHTAFVQPYQWRAETVVLRKHTWQAVAPSHIHILAVPTQPSQAQLYPFEEKIYTHYWMSCAGIDSVHQATKDALVGWTLHEHKAYICAYVSSTFRKAVARLWYGDKLIWKELLYLSPEHSFLKALCLPEGHLPEHYRFTLEASNGKILVTCPGKQTGNNTPSDTQPVLRPPSEIRSIEQLVLSGLQAEQQEEYDATEYYQEALRREPDDIRANQALGIWYLRRGKPDKAKPYFHVALQTLHLYPGGSPQGEAYYYLGCLHWMMGEPDEAREAFSQSSCHAPWQAASFLQLARLAAMRADYNEALELVEQSLWYQPYHAIARHLKTSLLRKCCRLEEALVCIQESLAWDVFNYGCLFEKWRIDEQQQEYTAATTGLGQVQQQMQQGAQTYISFATDYMWAGMYQEALDFLGLFRDTTPHLSPLVFYYKAFCADKCHLLADAANFAAQAMRLSPDFCFPNRNEDRMVLQAALQRNAYDARASYYLGNFWYAHQQYTEALDCWQYACHLDDAFPTVHRNLALAYARHTHTLTCALAHLEKAFDLDPTDARVLLELDQLYRRLNTPHSYRLALLEEHLPLTESCDDLYLERMFLYSLLGDYARVRDLLMARRFYTGKESKIHLLAHYRTCHIELAKRELLEGNAPEALALLSQVEQYLTELSEEIQEIQTDMLYLKGWACQVMAATFQAELYFQMATSVPSNWQELCSCPEKGFYQGLAWKMLQIPARATLLFQQLIDMGRMGLKETTHLPFPTEPPVATYFFDRKPATRNRIHWYYVLALGYLGLGNTYHNLAEEYFARVLELDNSHQGAILFRRMLHGQALLLPSSTPSEHGWNK